jgi:hypothetical protein
MFTWKHWNKSMHQFADWVRSVAPAAFHARQSSYKKQLCSHSTPSFDDQPRRHGSANTDASIGEAHCSIHRRSSSTTHLAMTVNMNHRTCAHFRRWRRNFAHSVVSIQRVPVKCTLAEPISRPNRAILICQPLVLSKLLLPF